MIKTYSSRDGIAKLVKNGMKNSAISSRLESPIGIVQKIVKQWKEGGHVQASNGLSTSDRCVGLLKRE